MSESLWFKHWARKSLASTDLNMLSDHQERLWWRLMAVASTEEPRWYVSMTLRELAGALGAQTTSAKVRDALKTFRKRGMITGEDGGFFITHWEQYQINPSTKRVREHRERLRESVSEAFQSVTQSVTVTPQETTRRAEEQKSRSTTTASAVAAERPRDFDGSGFQEKYLTIETYCEMLGPSDYDAAKQVAEAHDLDDINAALIRVRKRKKSSRIYVSELWRELEPEETNGTANQRRRPGSVVVSNGSDWEAADRARDLLPRRSG